MAAEAKRNGVRAVAAVGTAGLRIAANSADAIAAIRERSGVKVDVVSGEDEARLAYLATTAALGPATGSIAVFDTGGGSSQFTFGQKGRIEERFSVDVGAARYTERFRLDREVSEDGLEQAMAQISTDLARLDGRPSPDLLVGMGGAVTNITAVALGLAEYDPSRVPGRSHHKRRDRPTDRPLSIARRRCAPFHHRSPAKEGRGHSRRGLRRANGAAKAGQDQRYGQRSRSPTRSAG